MNSMRATLLLLATGLVAGLAITPGPAFAKVIHQEKSLYRNIIVRETGERRCLIFSVKRQDRNQTCMNLKDSKQVVFPYVRMTFAGLLVNPNPSSLLMIGLGGGTISTVLGEVFPDMQQDLVEVDPAVVKVAREYFDFSPGPNTDVYTQDGRVFTRRAAKQGKTYDLIILDAFTGEYIPEHLMSAEFLGEVKSLLNPGGVVVANTFSASDLYDHESVTYEQVFGPFFNFKMPGSGNRVIVATGEASLPDIATMNEHAGMIASELAPYSVNLLAYPRFLDTKRDWNPAKRALTDQYSPANLLREN